MSDRQDIVDQYMDKYFRHYDGENGVRNLDNLCQILGYGTGYMRNRAIEEMLSDNPGVIELIAERLSEGMVCYNDWNNALREYVEENVEE